MGERDRYQSQYDRERARYDYDEPQRDSERESYRARVQPREWQPSDDYRRTQSRDWQPSEDYRRTQSREWERGDYRRDPRGRFAGYYAERQYGTRGLDEREQGARFGAEEEHYRPRQQNAWGRPSNDWGTPNSGEYGRNDYPQHQEESVGQQLRDVGHRIARTVKRAFRGPKGYKRSDERIREDVSDRMGEHEHLDCSEIEVSVKDGEVTLTGTVNTRQEKFLAEEVADDVSGVNDVHNQLRVKREQTSPQTFGTTESSASLTEPARNRNARA